MTPRRARPPKLRDNRYIIGGLLALLFLLTALFYVLQRGRDIPPALLTNRVLLFVLYYVNVVLILAVLFVLFRNVFKLAVERRYRILGSKFKVKLVATYIGLSLLPVILLFAIAFEILQGSVDRWFDPERWQGLEQGRNVAQALLDRVEQSNLTGSRRVLEVTAGVDLDVPEERPALNRRLTEQLDRLGLDLLAVYRGPEFVSAVVDPGSGIQDLPDLPRRFLEEAASEGEAVTSLRSGEGDPTLLLLGASAVAPARGPASETAPSDAADVADAADAPNPSNPSNAPAVPTVVVAGTRIEPRVAYEIDQLIQEYQSFRQLEVQKEELQASQLLFFLMITLVILLTSSWVGLYLARRVTTPIQALARGTRHVSRGDLHHRVEVEADDELGVLVDSFNRMTAELARNKEVIEESHRQLVTGNEVLAAERSRIAAVVENIAAGVLTLDPAGRVVSANGAALSMLRQTEADLRDRRYDEAWDSEERRGLLDFVRRGRRATRVMSDEVQILVGGEWRTLEATLTPLPVAEPPAPTPSAPGTPGVPDAEDGASRVLVLEDLTELIKAQQHAAWSDAARRIAHEIKNPLTPIRLSAERLLHRWRKRDPELGAAIEDSVEIIVREVGSMQSMVDEFSRFARMPRPRPEEVDLPTLLDDTLHLYRGIKPGVSVESEVEDGLSTAWFDREQVRRALINLLDNAVEATEAPGTVRVEAARRDHHLEIRVADTGRGIPPELKEKLFLPHVSTKGRGTGLGLAIVHRIIADHRGTIRVEDNRPRGTVFTVELPLR